MERDEQRQDAAGSGNKEPGRTWTRRVAGPVKYRRFTANDCVGRPSILFKFEPSSGQADLPPEIYDILKSVKFLNRNPDLGHGSGRYPTGLQFMRGKPWGKVWRLPDDSTGRTAADWIDAQIKDLMGSLEQDSNRSR
jgi:hypothetical protein